MSLFISVGKKIKLSTVVEIARKHGVPKSTVKGRTMALFQQQYGYRTAEKGYRRGVRGETSSEGSKGVE